MTTNNLPTYIQPLRLAERGATLAGQIALNKFSRLMDVLSDSEGVVEVNLDLGQDEKGFPFIQGRLKSNLHLQCQRCLQTMDYPLSLAVSLSPLLGEGGVAGLPGHYEPLVLEEDQVLLTTLIEDEVLLSLPIAPKHEDEDCAKA